MKHFIYFISMTFLIINLAKAQTPTWAEDIAPIFFNKCTKCHHTGGIAPFTLTDYNTAYTWRNTIKYDVQNGIMPPWPPDTSYTRFVDERILTSSEVQKIVDWVNGGAPAGNLSNAPAPPTYTTLYQLPGTPDLVVKIPTYVSNATTNDDYVCFSVPINNPTLRYVKAVEIVPGNPSIVHHVIATADTSSTKPTTTTTYSNCYNVMGQFGLAGYDPGSGPVILPSAAPYKFGIPLYPNCNIVIQIHYPKGSVGQTDSTQVRLFLYPASETGIREVYTAPLLENWYLNIPANTVQSYTNTCPTSGIFNNCKFPFDITVLAANPHQHLIGKKLVNYAVSPSLTDTIPLMRINNWNFDWQGYYFYKKPVKIPANYKWIGEHVYDNTASNPNNPNNPPQTITAGYQTSDEMFFDSFVFTLYQPGDENINMDSLMTVSVREFFKNTTTSAFALYPNPASEYITLIHDMKGIHHLWYQIKTMHGQTVLRQYITHPVETIDISQLPPSVYLVELMNNKQILSSKKLIIVR